jgi:hypothetical protein
VNIAKLPELLRKYREFAIPLLNTYLLYICIAYTACRSWTKQNSLNR